MKECKSEKSPDGKHKFISAMRPDPKTWEFKDVTICFYCNKEAVTIAKPYNGKSKKLEMEFGI